ncbi:TonB-dependent receptor [uncultured Bacteroides sp.]|uniref:TonB-dependent receptor n=1 Tax=uncultured Bacteroides sp. TaxID=162156 RepID=UPI002AA5FBD1|nr:TonB-dependent receptor [uncultured Bacteroides sp.]
MKTRIFYAILIGCSLSGTAQAQVKKDSIYTKNGLTLNEVVVTGTRNETDIRHLPMSISVINQQQIGQRHEQSLLPILTEQVPGLFITGRGIMGYGVSTGAAGAMSLRGIGGNPTTGLLVLIDGHPQYMGLMGHPIDDAYQSMLAERVEVLRGPASVLYGSNAMGGVINIVTHQLKEDEIENRINIGYGSYNTLTTEASSRIRQGRFSSVATASYNRTDGHRADMGFEQYSGYVKLGYEFSSAWNAFADINLTHFNASNPGAVETPLFDNDSRITRGMTSLSVENNYKRTSGAFKVFYNWGRHKINDGYSAGEDPTDYRFNSKDMLLGITWYQSASLFSGNRITVGVDYQHLGGEAWNQYTGSRSEIADKSANEIAGYADFRQALGSLFTLDMAMRLDHHSQSGTEWVPQVGLSVHLPRTAELKAIVSKGFRNPTIRELYMFGSQNPNLLPEKIINYEISFSQHLINNSLTYGLNLYYINGDNMIQTVYTNGRPMNVNTGKIENWGIEANTAYRINLSWSISANYSWLHMKNPVVAAPEHKLYLGMNFSQKRWSLSTGMQYINELYTSVNPETKENFVLWNLRGSYHLNRLVSLFARGENLLAQRYEINAGYPMPKATILGGVNLLF